MNPFIGSIITVGFNFAPEKWSRCEGQQLQITKHQALFGLLGNAFGGDGRASFSLPDLRGKFAMGQGTCLGSNHEWKVGTSTGSETCTLTEKELPSHSHLTTFTPGVISRKGSLVATTEEATSDVPVTGAFLAKSIEVGSGKDDLIYKSKPSENSFVELSGINIGFYGGVPSGKVIVDDMGFNQAFHILQPGLVVSYLIAMEGLFPSRS